MKRDELFPVPKRSDGSPKAWWFDREGGHMIHRLPDGSLEAVGWECRHPVDLFGVDT